MGVKSHIWGKMNAITPFVDFRPAYLQLEQIERKFVDGYVADIEGIAEKTGQRLEAVLHAPFPYELDNRAVALLALPLVRAAIAERIKELSNLYDISIYRTLKELTAIAYSNISNYIDIDVCGVPEVNLTRCTPEQLSALKSIEIDDKPRGGRKVKIVMHDKLGALINGVMRYQGLLQEDNPHWKSAEQSTTAPNVARLPAGMDDDSAADAYARVING